MRVYVATTVAELAASWERGAIAASAPAHAVTPALREWYVDDDPEELEYAATLEAARDSLRLLAADDLGAASADGARVRRVVLAVEIDDHEVGPPGMAAGTPDGAGARSRVQLRADVPMDRVAAVHLDDVQAADAVRAAVAALPAAERGDEDAAFVVDEAFGHELLWFARQEIPHLLSE